MRRRWISVALVSLLAAAVATFSLPVLGATSFEDVPDDHIFAADIDWLASEGITQGCNPPDNTRFCPDDAVTRGQMAAFLVRALSLTEAGPTFTDTDGHIFQADISRLAEAGITRGCNPPDNTRFCPDDAVTRGQMAAFLNRGLDVLAPFEALAVAAGNTQTCAVAADGAPWCWGRNADGQLGNGGTTESAIPVPVADAPASVDVVAGGFHSCLLAADGAAWCWGFNGNGQLGAGNTVHSAVPVPVTGSHVFTSIDSGRHHVCGLEGDGTAWCWGFNDSGQLATGDVDSRTPRWR